jgi:lipocalin
MNKIVLLLLAVLGLGLTAGGCRHAESTAAIPAVAHFDRARYLGTWYEIARYPHWFERDMDFVTAEYALRDDGKISVLNSGVRDGKRREARGVARMKGAADVGELEVSFFRPFYGDYRIIELDPDYSVVVVTSSTRDYLWILARSPQLDREKLAELLKKIQGFGFDVAKLEYPQQ